MNPHSYPLSYSHSRQPSFDLTHEKQKLHALKQFSKSIDELYNTNKLFLYNNLYNDLIKEMKASPPRPIPTPAYFGRPINNYIVSDYLLNPDLLYKDKISDQDLDSLIKIVDKLINNMATLKKGINTVYKLIF